MKYCLYYWLFEPLRGGLIDTPERTPAIQQAIKFENDTYDFRIYCDENNIPEFARVRIENLDKEEIPEDALEILQIIKEHLLTTLKLTYRKDIQFFPFALWSFIEESKEEIANVLAEYRGKHNFDKDLVQATFISSITMREELRLYADGIDERIPLQYQFLSLYKLIELKFRNNGVWDRIPLNNLLNQYHSRFMDLGINLKPINLMHNIRDKCAHIKSRKNKYQFGVTQLNHKEASLVSTVLPIFREICKDLVNEAADGRFVLGSTETYGEPETFVTESNVSE